MQQNPVQTVLKKWTGILENLVENIKQRCVRRSLLSAIMSPSKDGAFDCVKQTKVADTPILKTRALTDLPHFGFDLRLITKELIAIAKLSMCVKNYTNLRFISVFDEHIGCL
jgi:hypothetical protein